MKKIFMLLGLILCATVLCATDIYVSPSGDGTAPLSGFATGYASIYDAVENAETGDTIILDRATIPLTSGNLTISKAIAIKGAGTPEETIIDGENKGAIIKTTTADVVMNNFTITRTGSAWAGVMAMEFTKATYVTNVVAHEIGNTFTGNGRYLFKTATGCELVSCIITNNICPGNPGLNMNGGTLENCLIANNQNKGNSISKGIIEGNSGTIRNCTIVNNKCDTFAINGNNFKIYNSIIYDNIAFTSTDVRNWAPTSNGTANWINNCIAPVEGIAGSDNFSENPQFVPDSYYFLASSPCRNSANPEYAPLYDLDGVERGSTPSVGCVEYKVSDILSCVILPSKLVTTYPNTIELTVTLDGSYTEPLTYSWDIDGDGEEDEATSSVILSNEGTYYPQLTLTDAGGKSATASIDPVTIFGPDLTLYATNTVNPNAKSPYSTPETAGFLVDTVVLCPDGGKVILLPGTYEENGDSKIGAVFAVSKPITITSLDRDDTIIKTTSGSRFAVMDHKDSVIENLTFTGSDYGNYAPGAAIYIKGGTLRNCRFADFSMIGHGLVQIDTSTMGVVSHCSFENITASYQGPAGIKVNAGNALITDCYFTNLVSDIDNISYPASAIDNRVSATIVRNSTFIGTRCTIGAPVGSLQSGMTVENCILTMNTTNSPTGPLPCNDLFCGSAVLKNIRSNCLYPAILDYTGKEKIFTCDPFFKGAPFLSPHSPLVGQGVNEAASSELDLWGNRRIKGRNIDIGCAENQISLSTRLILK